MKLFLHITISENFPSFNSSIRDWLNEHLGNVQYFDVDNHSDQLVASTAKQAIDEAECVFVWLECEPEPPGNLLGIIKYLAKFEKKHPLIVAYRGNNPMFQKLEKGFQREWITLSDEGQLQARLGNFFTS